MTKKTIDKEYVEKLKKEFAERIKKALEEYDSWCQDNPRATPETRKEQIKEIQNKYDVFI